MAKKSGKTGSKKSATKAAVKKKTAAKTLASKPVSTAPGPRRLKPPRYKLVRIRKPMKHPVKLPNVWHMAKTASLILWRHKRLFIGITLVYGLLNLVLVRGLAGGTDVGSLKHEFSQVFHGNFSSLTSGLSVFVILVGSAGNGSSQTAGAYQVFLALITSLAIIWALRQVLAGSKLRIRDAYYRGMYPLIPFVLVLVVIAIQLIPLIAGSVLYGLVTADGIAVHFDEVLGWGVLWALLALGSLYMVSSSIFALYIVTLPDMTPRKALRSAREIVRHRRWTVLRKILCLPIMLLVVAAVIMLPIIVWLTPLTQWVFFALTMFALVATHAYMYTLYRELLDE